MNKIIAIVGMCGVGKSVASEFLEELGYKKVYFGEEEERAFVEYVNSTDQAFRDKIFAEKLYYPFTKMIESIIRRYNLFTPDEDFEETFFDAISFLITKINNFDTTKNKKAYSYCGTICKNYLILKRTQYSKKIQRQVSYDLLYPNSDNDNRTDINQEKQLMQESRIFYF